MEDLEEQREDTQYTEVKVKLVLKGSEKIVSEQSLEYYRKGMFSLITEG